MMNNKIALILFFIFAFCASTYSQSTIYDAGSPKREVRAVWLTTIGGIDWPRNKSNGSEYSIERQKRELCDQLDRLQKININTILIQTRVRASMIYPSAIEPWDECLTGHYGQDPGYDPLAFAIEECHKRGMELHAWLVTIPLGKTARLQKQGGMSIRNHHPQLCKSVGGESFMKPGNPETAEYVAALCREIVEKYDVDGISLDYIRYPESSFRFSDDELYNSELSRDDWRRENITRIVKAVHDTVKPIKPWVKLSSSPLGRYDDLSRYSAKGWSCYRSVYQDPKLWLEEHYQDMLFPMMYFQGDLFYPFLFNWKEISNGHPVASGLGIYFLDKKEKNWPLSTITAELYSARKSGVGGICFYRNMYLMQNTKGIYDLCRNFFNRPALPPQMKWMGDIAAPAKPDWLSISDGIISWNSVDSVLYNVYASNEYPVDTEKAENIVAASLNENMLVLPQSAKNKLYFAVTTMDRFGNESIPIQIEGLSEGRDKIEQAVKRHFSQPVVSKSKKKRKR